MGLVQGQKEDRRPRDWSYRVVFDRKDLPSLQKMTQHIRESHDTDMIEDFNTRCEQKLNSSTERTELDNGIEIQSVTKTEDLVVNVGLQECIKIIQGTGGARWTYIQVSSTTGPNSPTVSDTGINSSGGGVFSLALATYGWAEARGMKLFFGAIGAQIPTGGPLGDDSVHEMGVFNGSAPGPTSVMLNRETFFNQPLNRNLLGVLTLYNAVFMFSSVIEFCPVA